MKFHDGSEFNADAVVFNLEKILKKDAPQSTQAQATQASLYSGGIGSWKKIDDYTVEITTKIVDAVLPFSLCSIFMSSPARYAELGRDWGKFAEKPSGTGPWMLESFKPRERAELVRNPNHWDKSRIPKSERLVLIPHAGRQCARRGAPLGPGRFRGGAPAGRDPAAQAVQDADRHQRLSA